MKTIHSIIRTEKIKTFGLLSAKNNHNHRLSDVPNTAPKNNDKVLIGSDDIVSDVKSHLIKQGINPEKIRKNGGICNELICSLSPEYFIDNTLDYKGKWTRAPAIYYYKKYGVNPQIRAAHADKETTEIYLKGHEIWNRADATQIEF